MISLSQIDLSSQNHLFSKHPFHRPVGHRQSVTIAASLSGDPVHLPRTFQIVAGVLAIVALSVSVYLGWVGLTSSKVVGCDGGVFDCSHVLTSRWSLVAGVPVAIPATALYVGVLASLVLLRSDRDAVSRLAWNTLTVLSITAGLTAIWFIGLQLFSIGKLCPYCLAVHGCGIAMACLMIYQNRSSCRSLGRFGLISTAMVGGLIATQALSEAPETFVIETAPAASFPAANPPADGADLFESPLDESPILQAPVDSTTSLSLIPLFSLIGVVMAPQEATTQSTETNAPAEVAKPVRTVPVNNGRKQLDVTKWPLWGNAESQNVVVEMFDYTCSHCRTTHAAIREASMQLGGDFAVIALPVPLNAACNDTVTATNPERADACEVARIAIAVWLVDRTKFTAFHDWLFEQSRSAADARQHASTLVDATALDATLAKSTPAKYIELNVQLYKEAGSGTIPKVSFPTTTVVGEVGSGSTLANMVRQYLAK